MLPLLLDIGRLRLVLVGNGAAALRRLRWLDDAGARDLVVYADEPAADLIGAAEPRLRRRLPRAEDWVGAQLAFIADPAADQMAALAEAAHQAGAIVHVEDVLELTDIHAPAVVRRGDLTIAISTGGKSPALAGQVKQYLAGLFGPEWQDHLVQLASLRTRWRARGDTAATIRRLTEEWVSRSGWLPPFAVSERTVSTDHQAGGEPPGTPPRH
jgi:precorrin-2 dehydrogenase/sirohydrochlorin ferrochelatase